MKRIIPVVFALMVISAVRAPHKKIQTPKAAEFEASLGKPMLSKQVAQISPTFVVLPPRTNFVFKINLAWDYDSNSAPVVTTFTFHMGTFPGAYTYQEDIGTNLFWTFARTNWGDDRMDRHFMVVTAKDAQGVESEPSNEVHFPPYPPDHFELSWVTNWDQVDILSSTDLTVPKEEWTLFASVVGTNSFSTNIPPSESCRFFILNKPDVLTIRAFNPNP